jgi:GNAT superfamily N-acetyltransferase
LAEHAAENRGVGSSILPLATMSPRRQVRLRPGRVEDAPALSALAMRSKGHWGYDQAFLDACRGELTVAPDRVATLRITVAEVDDVVAGFVSLAGDPPIADVSHLFVDPPFIGSGVGRTLFDAAVDTARGGGFTAFTVDADPGAEGFYLRMGAVRIGKSPSGSIPGRRLPRLRYDVAAS